MRYYEMGQLLQNRVVHRPKMHQGVLQKNLQTSLLSPISLFDASTNGGTYLQTGLMYNILKCPSERTDHFSIHSNRLANCGRLPFFQFEKNLPHNHWSRRSLSVFHLWDFFLKNAYVASVSRFHFTSSTCWLWFSTLCMYAFLFTRSNYVLKTVLPSHRLYFCFHIFLCAWLYLFFKMEDNKADKILVLCQKMKKISAW